jgi:flagellar basal-body rod modification protein FlgD
MIGTTTPLGTYSGTTQETADRMDLGRDTFLTLLVTQLRNQDPMDPMKSHEFAAQLASFSSLEQLTKISDGISAQTDSVLLSAQMSETAFSAALLDRFVVAVGNHVTIPASGSADIRVEIGGNGGEAKLRLLDKDGKEVATRDLGHLDSGRQTITLPADLPAGTYTYELTVTGAGNQEVPVVTYTSGIVDGISFSGDKIVLRIGSVDVLLDTVVEIERSTG